MVIIGEAMVENAVAEERFGCDLGACRGACCTLAGGRGAPLDDEETDELRRALPVVRKYLPVEHLRAIDEQGIFEGSPGNYTTTCFHDRDCVFVYYEGSVAKCSIERAFLEGELPWRKPLSCHLFPIRISGTVRPSLRYERIAECEPARRRGASEGIPLYEFLRDALTRKFGRAWYEAFRDACRRLRGDEPSGR